jgi:hypothetical protein
MDTPILLEAQRTALQNALDRHVIDYATDAPGLNRDGELVNEVDFNDWCDRFELWS